MKNRNKTITGLLQTPFDADCCMLDYSEADRFLKSQRLIAEIAVEKHFGELPVEAVEIYTALKEKNEAKFQEWVNA